VSGDVSLHALAIVGDEDALALFEVVQNIGVWRAEWRGVSSPTRRTSNSGKRRASPSLRRGERFSSSKRRILTAQPIHDVADADP
jgi:hypothetical protein